MTNDEKLEQMSAMLRSEGCECDNIELYAIYLSLAKRKILNRRFPYGTELDDVEEKYEQLQIELAICLFSQRGGEGQQSHSENGVSRVWRSENEILQEIVPYAGVPNYEKP